MPKSAAREYPGVAGNFAWSLDRVDQKLHFYVITASPILVENACICSDCTLSELIS